MCYDAPEPPDPYDTAKAATGQNRSTAIANAFLQNVNQITPDGNLTYNQTGNVFNEDALGDSYWRDASGNLTQAGEGDLPDGMSLVKGFYTPTFTATQTLSPDAQAIKEQGDRAKLNLSTFAADQSGRLGGLLSRPLDLSGAPAAGEAGNYSQFDFGPRLATSFGDAGDINMDFNDSFLTKFGDAGEITRTYGTDFSADRLRVEDAMRARMQPGIDRERDRLDTSLANKGIGIGSEAYGAAQDDFGRRLNDADLGIILAGGQEQSRLTGLERDRALFENAAQQQDYAQELGRGQFENQGILLSNAALEQENAAQAQDYGQLRDRAGFENDALQRMYQNYFGANQANNALASRTFDEQNANRAQWLNERYQERNQPINEIAALLSGSQIQRPNFVNPQIGAIPTVDMAGIINKNYDQRLNAAQMEHASMQSLFGGLFGLGASFI